MSDFDNGFRRAQRAYESQTPPWENEETKTCGQCEGEGCEICNWEGEITINTKKKPLPNPTEDDSFLE